MNLRIIQLRATDPDLTVIRAWYAGENSWIEFRAGSMLIEPAPYHTWGERPHDAAILHDLLIGPHASILHAGDTVYLLPRHPDYARVAAIMEQMDKARFPNLKNGRIVS